MGVCFLVALLTLVTLVTDKVSKRPAEFQNENPKPKKRGKTVTYNEYYIEYMEGVQLVKKFYEGEVGQERLVRKEFPDGTKQFYEGKKDQERIVRKEFHNGIKHFYEGEVGQERMVRMEFLDGTKQFYEGEKCQERVVRVESLDGIKYFLEGERGQERYVIIEPPDETKVFYEGERGQERVVRKEYPNGIKVFYKGERGQEKIVRKEFPDGNVDKYKSETLPNGETKYYNHYSYVKSSNTVSIYNIRGTLKCKFPYLEDEQESPEIQDCSVCLDHKSNSIFGCGHICICASCANDLRASQGTVKPKCPICRVPSQIKRCYF